MKKTFPPFILLLTTILFLYLLSFLDLESDTSSLSLRNFSLFADIQSKPEEIPTLKSDSVQYNDTSSTITTDSLKKIFSVTSKNIINTKVLQTFFEQLHQLEKETTLVRIAYFGDSMIEGDLLTSDLRDLLQKKFGGSGVGMVPLTSQTASFRRTITHTFSDDWKRYSLLDERTPKKPLGIMGYSFIPANESWVQYKSSNYSSRLFSFSHIKMLYGESDTNNFVLYKKDKRDFIQQNLPSNNSVNLFEIKPDSAFSIFYAKFHSPKPLNLFGISFENNNGIILDNFSFRGNAGPQLIHIPDSILIGFQSLLHYKLIILHYGLNATNPKTKDYSWYERGLLKSINLIKTSFPDASILLVSVSDKSYKHNGKYETDPSIPIIVEVQQRVAEKTGIAFWNLYEAMGGYNTMVNWVDGDTIYANKDYTHLNFRGGAKMGKLFYDELMEQYENYKRRLSK